MLHNIPYVSNVITLYFFISLIYQRLTIKSDVCFEHVSKVRITCLMSPPPNPQNYYLKNYYVIIQNLELFSFKLTTCITLSLEEKKTLKK